MKLPFGYVGCKQDEVQEVLKYLPSSFNTLVDPFCGSCSLSAGIWEKYPNTSVVVGDTYETLIEVLGVIRYEDPDHISAIIEGELVDITKERWVSSVKKPNWIWFLISNIWAGIRPGMFPANKKKPNFAEKLNTPEYKRFLQACSIELFDGLEMMERYRDDPDAFLVLDPPYIGSDNTAYLGRDKKLKLDELYETIKVFMLSCKCKVMLIINHSIFVRYMFAGMIKHKYPKRYKMSGSRVEHCIITNY